MKIFFAKWNFYRGPRGGEGGTRRDAAGTRRLVSRRGGVDFRGLGAGSPAHSQALGAFSLLFPRSWVMECIGAQHVLLCMLMVLPDQGGSLQGSPGVSQDILAVDDPGTGSGWQQSKQNWALPSVVGILGQNAMQ